MSPKQCYTRCILHSQTKGKLSFLGSVECLPSHLWLGIMLLVLHCGTAPCPITLQPGTVMSQWKRVHAPCGDHHCFHPHPNPHIVYATQSSHPFPYCQMLFSCIFAVLAFVLPLGLDINHWIELPREFGRNMEHLLLPWLLVTKPQSVATFCG